jgi:diphosphoinositol-polyphosphate diphosphatase
VSGGRILLCSSSKKAEWIIPKGGWELDETARGGACRETHEECGVLGTLGPALKESAYNARKGKREAREAGSASASPAGEGGGKGEPPAEDGARVCRARIFPLYVTEVLAEWPEDGRARRAFDIGDAVEAVTRPELRRAIEEVRERGLHRLSPEEAASMAEAEGED